MSLSAVEVEEALMALDPAERATVVFHGIESLDAEDAFNDQEEIEAAWREELRRRIQGIEAGTRELCSWEEIDAAMRRAIDARRP